MILGASPELQDAMNPRPAGLGVSTAVHLPSALIFSLLQEELLAWDLSRHCRQVPGRGDSHGSADRQAGRGRTHPGFPLCWEFGAQPEPRGSLSTQSAQDLFCTTLQLFQGCPESQHEALGSLSAVCASKGSHKILNLEHVPKTPIPSSRQHPVPISRELLS